MQVPKLDKTKVGEGLAVAAIAAMGTAMVLWLGLFDGLHKHAEDGAHTPVGAIAAISLVLALCLASILWRWNARLRGQVATLQVSETAVQSACRCDGLTGLSNLIGLYDDLADRALMPMPGHLLLVDINRFKSINDLRGHTAGDAILTGVAGRLTAACGPNDRAYRTGGDEFAIILTDATEGRSVGEFADMLTAAMSEPYDVDDWSEVLSCSIGIAAILADSDPSEIVQRADQAMHHAKATPGPGWAEFNEALGTALRGKALLEMELRDAIVANALVPFFQPILRIETGELTGFEVLARWHRPESGFVPPDVFIPMAEDLGLIDRLSDQLLRKCCAAMKGWDSCLTLSFNLSPRQLNHASLAERIKTILDDHGIAGRRLAIEITETAVFIDMDRARAVIAQLRAFGVRVSLDDFGIGTSSLAVLSQLPFDTIKIDRSFISNISDNPQNAKIVRGVLALARSLELTVTAEGIESDSDLDFLKENNCILGQGYFFSRPVPEDALPQLIEDVTRAAALAKGEVEALVTPVPNRANDHPTRRRRAGSRQ